MKRIILLAALFLTTTIIIAQVDFGIKVGINTFDVHDEVFESNFNDFTLAVAEAQYGFHAGVFLRTKLGPILFQPELIINSDNVDYTFDQPGIGETIVNQKYSAVDVPILAGFKLGPLRILTGPVGHYEFKNVTNLEDQIKTNTFSENVSLGFQVGAGFDLKKITFDLRYEANSSKLGDSLSIGGQDISFSQNRNRLIASIGYKF